MFRAAAALVTQRIRLATWAFRHRPLCSLRQGCTAPSLIETLTRLRDWEIFDRRRAAYQLTDWIVLHSAGGRARTGEYIVHSRPPMNCYAAGFDHRRLSGREAPAIRRSSTPSSTHRRRRPQARDRVSFPLGVATSVTGGLGVRASRR